MLGKTSSVGQSLCVNETTVIKYPQDLHGSTINHSWTTYISTERYLGARSAQLALRTPVKKEEGDVKEDKPREGCKSPLAQERRLWSTVDTSSESTPDCGCHMLPHSSAILGVVPSLMQTEILQQRPRLLLQWILYHFWRMGVTP